MKKLSCLAVAAAFTLAAAGSAFAQSPTPAVPAKPVVPAVAAPVMPKPQPVAAKPAPMKMSADEKAAMSKKCSADADTKGLHGKEREKFRNACKKGKS